MVYNPSSHPHYSRLASAAEAERTPPVSHLLLQVLAVGIASYWCQKL